LHRSETVTGPSFNTIGVIGHAGVEAEVGSSSIGIQECIKVKALQDIGVIQSAEVEIEGSVLFRN